MFYLCQVHRQTLRKLTRGTLSESGRRAGDSKRLWRSCICWRWNEAFLWYWLLQTLRVLNSISSPSLWRIRNKPIGGVYTVLWTFNLFIMSFLFIHLFTIFYYQYFILNNFDAWCRFVFNVIYFIHFNIKWLHID